MLLKPIRGIRTVHAITLSYIHISKHRHPSWQRQSMPLKAEVSSGAGSDASEPANTAPKSAETAIALFKGKGKGRNKSNGSKEPTDAQAESKRVASKRFAMLQQAPEHVRKLWEAICSLKGRDRGKNKQKEQFTKVLFRDRDFNDAYWQTEVKNEYKWGAKIKGRWILRQKAEWEDGGGSEGKKAVADAIACGHYESRKFKRNDANGNRVEIEEVRVSEDHDWQGTQGSVTDKIRGGQSLGSAEAQQMMVDDIMPAVMKKPAKAIKDVTQLALPAPDDDDEPNVLKRPAGFKRPAGAVTTPEPKKKQLTQGQVEDLNMETAAQNDRLNICLTGAVKSLNDHSLIMMKLCYQLREAEATGMNAKLRDVTLEEAERIQKDIAAIMGPLQEASIKMTDVKHTDAKIDLLTKAGDLQTEAKNVAKSGKQWTKEDPKSEKASKASKAG